MAEISLQLYRHEGTFEISHDFDHPELMEFVDAFRTYGAEAQIDPVNHRVIVFCSLPESD